MAFSVYFQLMSLNILLVSFAFLLQKTLLINIPCQLHKDDIIVIDYRCWRFWSSFFLFVRVYFNPLQLSPFYVIYFWRRSAFVHPDFVLFPFVNYVFMSFILLMYFVYRLSICHFWFYLKTVCCIVITIKSQCWRLMSPIVWHFHLTCLFVLLTNCLRYNGVLCDWHTSKRFS